MRFMHKCNFHPSSYGAISIFVEEHESFAKFCNLNKIGYWFCFYCNHLALSEDVHYSLEELKPENNKHSSPFMQFS